MTSFNLLGTCILAGLLLIEKATLEVSHVGAVSMPDITCVNPATGETVPCNQGPRLIYPPDGENMGPSQADIQHEKEVIFQEANEQGIAFHEAGEYEAAIKAFQKALQINPGDEIILQNIQKSEAQLARHQRIVSTQSRIQNLQERLARDMEAIRRLKFQKRAEDFEDWGKLAANQKNELQFALVDQLADKSIEVAGDTIRAGKSLNVVNIHEKVAQLRQAGVTDPFLIEALQKVASTPGKPEMAQHWLRILDRFKYLKDGIAAGYKLRSSGGLTEPTLEAIVRFLKYGLYNAPPLLLTVEGFEAIYLTGYTYTSHGVIKENVNRLTALSENDLYQLRSLCKRVEQDVKGLNSAKNDYRKLQELDSAN
jgi:tetratricopeptide (TPR) repeat protein